MIKGDAELYQLPELIVCQALGTEVLIGIEDVLLEHRASGEHASTSLQLDRYDSVVQIAKNAPLENLMEIATAIRRFQEQRYGLLGTMIVHAAIVPYLYEPKWHSEPHNDSFIATTKVATEGLAGKVPGSYWAKAAEFVLQQAEIDPEFTNVPNVSIIRPPVHSLLHVPYGAFHRSSPLTPDSPAEKLIVNASILPVFMSNV